MIRETKNRINILYIRIFHIANGCVCFLQKLKILIDERVSMARMQFIHNLSQIFYLWNFQDLRKGPLIRNDRLLGQEISDQIRSLNRLKKSYQ